MSNANGLRSRRQAGNERFGQEGSGAAESSVTRFKNAAGDFGGACCGCGVSAAGPPGPPGPDGNNGADGQPGTPGRDGPDGPQQAPTSAPHVSIYAKLSLN